MIYHCQRCEWKGQVKAKHPRCLECSRKRIKEWRARNPVKAKAQRARYSVKFRRERPDEYRAKRRKRYLPATAKRARARRIAWLKEGTVTAYDLKEIIKLYGCKCIYCGTAIKPRYSPFDPRGFDHVTSREKGGKHEKANIVPCCRRCNEFKH